MPMTYQDLIGPKSKPGSIHNFVNWSKTPVEVLLEEGQALIYSRLRVREMKASAVLTLAVGESSLLLPPTVMAGDPPAAVSTGQFLEAISMMDREGFSLIPGDPLRGCGYVSDDVLNRMRVYTENVLEEGAPTSVAIFDERFQFDVRADEERKYDLIYYKRPDYLAPANNTNFLTNRYPHLIRTSCEAAAAKFKRDWEDYRIFREELFALCDAANAESDLSRAS